MNFEGNPATTIILTYAPTECSNDDTAQEYYKSLSDVIKHIPAHNLMLVIGDFKA